MAKGKILIIEDEREISSLLSNFLRENGYETEAAYEGSTASLYMKETQYDIILMDLMLPKKPGEILMRELREYSDTPMIVISAKSMRETKISMLKMGADDYILKPFDLEEVLVRIEVVLRRGKTEGESETDKKNEKVLACGELKLFVEENRVVFGEKVLPLR